MNTTNISPHIKWIIGLLLLGNITLISVKWSQYPNFVDRMNFAATLASLILAILAIVYAVYANDALSRSVARLETTGEQMSQNNAKFEATLHQVSTGIATVGDALNKLASSQQPAANPPPQTENVDALKLLQYFLGSCSWNGLKVMHACQLAHRVGRSFSLQGLCAKDTRMTYDYAYGYLVATGSTGLLTQVDEPGGMTRVTVFPETVRIELGAEIERRLKDGKDSPQLRENEIKAIDAFFA